MHENDLEYVGFWKRTGATLIDAILQMVLAIPLTMLLYGQLAYNGKQVMGKGDVFINVILPMVLSIFMWVKFGATPGKMAMSAKVVDATYGKPLSLGKSILRYFAYFVSIAPLGLGFLWIAFDGRKQGWHDKIANSVVVRPMHSTAVRFEEEATDERTTGKVASPWNR